MKLFFQSRLQAGLRSTALFPATRRPKRELQRDRESCRRPRLPQGSGGGCPRKAHRQDIIQTRHASAGAKSEAVMVFIKRLC